MSVWYMAHPLASDEFYTREQNMAHVLEMVRFFLDNGVHVIAPYHTHMLVLDDTNEEHRRLGLEIDCKVVKQLGRLILVGHRISWGMNKETDALQTVPGGKFHDLTAMTKAEIKTYINRFNLEDYVVRI